MRKTFVSIAIFFATLFIAFASVLYFQPDSRSVTICTPLDNTIRPRTSCLMDPLRDKRQEETAEEILTRLKDGEVEILVPYLSHKSENDKYGLLQNEETYQITSWRIGGIEERSGVLWIKYWVSRKHYPPTEEEVNFRFVREGSDWKLDSFSAVY